MVRVSSTNSSKPSFSSMVATGNKPPYAVRFRAEKSYGVEAPIFKGSGITVSAPCPQGVFSLCFRLFFTFWVTPENESAKHQLHRFPCFNPGFSGSPKGSLLHRLLSASNPVHRSASTVPGGSWPELILLTPASVILRSVSRRITEVNRDMSLGVQKACSPPQNCVSLVLGVPPP